MAANRASSPRRPTRATAGRRSHPRHARLPQNRPLGGGILPRAGSTQSHLTHKTPRPALTATGPPRDGCGNASPPMRGQPGPHAGSSSGAAGRAHSPRWSTQPRTCCSSAGSYSALPGGAARAGTTPSPPSIAASPPSRNTERGERRRRRPAPPPHAGAPRAAAHHKERRKEGAPGPRGAPARPAQRAPPTRGATAARGPTPPTLPTTTGAGTTNCQPRRGQLAPHAPRQAPPATRELQQPPRAPHA